MAVTGPDDEIEENEDRVRIESPDMDGLSPRWTVSIPDSPYKETDLAVHATMERLTAFLETNSWAHGVVLWPKTASNAQGYLWARLEIESWNAWLDAHAER